MAKQPGILEQLTKAAQQKRGGDEQEEDLNQVPLPDIQNIKQGKCIEWIWDCGIGNVTGILYTEDQEVSTEQGNNTVSKGTYEVRFAVPGVQSSNGNFILNVLESKNIGMALLSASGYDKVWKDHAGKFIEKELGLDA